MAEFRLPLSGDVNQIFQAWTAFMSPVGSQIGLINVNLGRSNAPEMEADILREVGSYGRQIGQIGDALAVLLEHFHPKKPLSDEEERAIRKMRVMLEDIAEIRGQHRR